MFRPVDGMVDHFCSERTKEFEKSRLVLLPRAQATNRLFVFLSYALNQPRIAGLQSRRSLTELAGPGLSEHLYKLEISCLILFS